MRGCEYKGRHPILKKVLRANAGDNVHPVEDNQALQEQVAEALHRTMIKLTPYCTFPKDMHRKQYCWEKAEACIRKDGWTGRVPEGGITATEIKKAKVALNSKGLAISAIDKNRSSLCLLCPVMLHRILKKMYPEGDTYVRVHMKEEKLLDKMAESAAQVMGQIIGVKQQEEKKKQGQQGMTMVERMRTKLKELPRAYAFPKEKDLWKGRPIVPYRRHGMRPVLGAAARALLFIINRLEKEGKLNNFTLRACTDLAESLKGINNEMDSMETADGQRRGLKLRMYDVKSMFTALPRTEILRAVDGLLALAAEQTWGRNARKRWIVVPKRRDEQKEFTCVTGSAAVADGQIHYGFTFQQIREVLVWDMDNVYFKVGDTILKQVNGLPMGSPPSPVLANLTCGFGYEKDYIAEVGTSGTVGTGGKQKVWGIRSMDDVVMVASYKLGDQQSERNAVRRIEQLKYHDSMELERTDDDTAEWQRYLEGEVSIQRERLDVRYFNANSVSLQGNGTCVKPKVQSGASYIPTVIRRSYVYGTLKRIAGYGLNAAQMQLTAGRHLIMELKAAGWIGIKQMIWGAGQHILDKETRCALVRFIDIMEQRHHIE